MTFQRDNPNPKCHKAFTKSQRDIYADCRSAVLPVTNDLVTQFALPSKDKLIRTDARTRKQLDVNMPHIPVAQNFEIPEIFENFIRFDSGSNDHERIILHFVRRPRNA